jgi:hypothetical protein
VLIQQRAAERLKRRGLIVRRVIDQDVDVAKGLIGRYDYLGRRIGIGQVGLAAGRRAAICL